MCERHSRYGKDPDISWDELLLVYEWISVYGWEKTETAEFEEFCKEKGIDKSKLTLRSCRVPDYA